MPTRDDERARRTDAEALEQGRFYSSTGVQLDVLDTTASDIHVVVKATSYSKYRIQFIGQAGRVLAETAASEARYTFTGGERYVRAKVLESNGAVAWTQPVGVGAQPPR